METDWRKKVIALAAGKGILRPRDLDEANLPRPYLYRLQSEGVLAREGWGAYRLADAPVTANHALARVASRVPRGVICLLSALQFHGLTTQSPFQVWLAIGRKDWRPRLEYPPLRVVRFSEGSLEEGVGEHLVEGIPVRIFDPAKTVADCFKFRSQVGLDVAIESLRDFLRQKKGTMEQLINFAEVDRVARVMRPYLEAMAG
jgi:predicted transcriptional regulator of viral defense system